MSGIANGSLEREAHRQFGAFHITQAAGYGWTKSRLYRERRAGRIASPLPGVCTFTASPSSRLQDFMVAQLWAEDASALGKWSAAELHELDTPRSRRIHVVTSRDLRSPCRSIRVHRRPPLPPSHVVERGVFRLTSIPRTLFELAWELTDERLDAAIDDALSRDLVTLGHLWGMWIEFHACGRNGSVRFRVCLDHRTPTARPPSNRNERRFLDLVRRAHLPVPLCQVPLYDGAIFVARPDFLFPAHRLAVEAQSRRFHGTVAQRIADDARAARLDALGWRILRVWWEEMEQDPLAVARRVKASLDAGATSRT